MFCAGPELYCACLDVCSLFLLLSFVFPASYKVGRRDKCSEAEHGKMYNGSTVTSWRMFVSAGGGGAQGAKGMAGRHSVPLARQGVQ